MAVKNKTKGEKEMKNKLLSIVLMLAIIMQVSCVFAYDEDVEEVVLPPTPTNVKLVEEDEYERYLTWDFLSDAGAYIVKEGVYLNNGVLYFKEHDGGTICDEAYYYIGTKEEAAERYNEVYEEFSQLNLKGDYAPKAVFAVYIFEDMYSNFSGKPVLIDMNTGKEIENNIISSAICGETSFATLDDKGTLSIIGTGVVNRKEYAGETISDYFYDYFDYIKDIVIRDGITEVYDERLYCDVITFPVSMVKAEGIEAEVVYIYNRNFQVSDSWPWWIVYCYKNSPAYNKIMDANNKNWSITHLMDIEETTGWYKDVIPEEYRDAAEAMASIKFLDCVFTKHGQNLIKDDFIKGLVSIQVINGDGMLAIRSYYNESSADLGRYNDLPYDTDLHGMALYGADFGLALGEDIFGSGEEVTYKQFLKAAMTGILYYTEEEATKAKADELGIGLAHLTEDSKVKYEEASQLMYNILKAKVNDNYEYAKDRYAYQFHDVGGAMNYRREEAKNYAPCTLNAFPGSQQGEKTIELAIGKIGATVNGQNMSSDAAPQIVNDRTMIPVRVVSEAMGANVSWDGATKTVGITLGSDNIQIIIGSNVAYVNGEAKELDSPAFIDASNGRTYIPLRFVAENFGAEVIWNSQDRTVTIIK